MQNEKNFFYHSKKFEDNVDFVIFLVEIFYDTLEYDVLDSNVFLLFGVNNVTVFTIITIFNNALVFNC